MTIGHEVLIDRETSTSAIDAQLCWALCWRARGCPIRWETVVIERRPTYGNLWPECELIGIRGELA